MASFFDQFSIGFKLRNDKQKKPYEYKNPIPMSE